MTSVVSRKTHGTAGTYDIDLPLSGNPGVENRSEGGNGAHTIVATLSNGLTGGSASMGSGTGSVSNSSVTGNTITVNLTGVPDQQTIAVRLSNVTDSSGQTLPPIDVPMDVLLGDITGNGVVNSSDGGQVKANAGVVLSASNYRSDVIANGSINSSDVGAVKAASGSAGASRSAF